jgi:hypothetical protein
VLAGALLCLHVGARYFELTRLHKSEAALDASIEDAFRAAMPGQQNATNARRRVEARLAEINGGGGGGACCPRCRPSPMRAAPPRRPASKASPFVTAPSTCASPRRMPPVSMPSASNCAPRVVKTRMLFCFFSFWCLAISLSVFYYWSDHCYPVFFIFCFFVVFLFVLLVSYVFFFCFFWFM